LNFPAIALHLPHKQANTKTAAFAQVRRSGGEEKAEANPEQKVGLSHKRQCRQTISPLGKPTYEMGKGRNAGSIRETWSSEGEEVPQGMTSRRGQVTVKKRRGQGGNESGRRGFPRYQLMGHSNCRRMDTITTSCPGSVSWRE